MVANHLRHKTESKPKSMPGKLYKSYKEKQLKMILFCCNVDIYD